MSIVVRSEDSLLVRIKMDSKLLKHLMEEYDDRFS